MLTFTFAQILAMAPARKQSSLPAGESRVLPRPIGYPCYSSLLTDSVAAGAAAGARTGKEADNICVFVYYRLQGGYQQGQDAAL